MRPVESLKPYARNPRTHSEAQINGIMRSIEKFGFTNPILLDGENVIIAGHGRLQAAILLGMKTVPCVDLHGMTAAEKRAYIIADNQLALNAGWDMEMLSAEILELAQGGIDISLLGFSDKELAGLQSIYDDSLARTGTSGELNPDAMTFDTACPRCGFEFNLPNNDD